MPYDHSVLTASLVTNIFKLYNTSFPLILAPVMIHVPSVNAPTHFPSICGCKVESQTVINNRGTLWRNFSIVILLKLKNTQENISFIYDEPSHFSTTHMIYGINVFFLLSSDRIINLLQSYFWRQIFFFPAYDIFQEICVHLFILNSILQLLFNWSISVLSIFINTSRPIIFPNIIHTAHTFSQAQI